MEGNTTTHEVSNAEGQLDPQTLLSIANEIPDHISCCELVVKLGLPGFYVRRVFASHFSERLPVDILQYWVNVKGKEATGKALHRILLQANMKYIADTYAGILLDDNED